MTAHPIDSWFDTTRPSKRTPWRHDPSKRLGCEHHALTIAETATSIIGPDPLFTLRCACGDFAVLQVGAPGNTEHATPSSPMGRLIRARLSRGKGTGYY